MASFPIFQVIEGEWTSEKFVDVLGLKMPAYYTPGPSKVIVRLDHEFSDETG